ncbi:hypothetical protein JZ751_017701, partial [Albula glossodonta]
LKCQVACLPALGPAGILLERGDGGTGGGAVQCGARSISTSYLTEPEDRRDERKRARDCREEQYPCTRLYSVHKPCRQCLNSLCFYSLRRVYVVNKEVCVRTVCAHEELLRADICRDQFSRCGVAALSGQCGGLGSSCGKSCGGC